LSFLAFELLFEWITSEADALFANHLHADFAQAPEVGWVTHRLNSTNVLAMATGEGREFGDFAIGTD